VSTEGGEEPIWSRDGRELFYRFGAKWKVVSVQIGDRFSAALPQPLFEGPFVNVPGFSYDVAPDARRFLVIQSHEQQGAVHRIDVLLNGLTASR
jgi:hypothetical protein